jgi:hypothetical protein
MKEGLFGKSDAEYEREAGEGRASLGRDMAAATQGEVPFGDEDDLKTVGDLKQLIAQAKRLKNTNAMKGELGDTIKSVATLGGADLLKVIKSTYKLPDSVNPGPGLSHLNVDDHVSAIVDDNLENDFLKTLEAELKSGGIPDETPLPQLDITQMLSNFIQGKHDKRTVTVPEES